MSSDLPLEISSLRVALMVAVLGVSVVTDLRSRRIYNALTIPAMVLGVAVNVLDMGMSGTLVALSGLMVGALLFALPVAFLERGAGDLKLLASLGAIGGPEFVLWCGLWAGVAGGVLAIGVLLVRRNIGPVLAGMTMDAATGHFPIARCNIRLPYAVPIAFGAVLTLVLT